MEMLCSSCVLLLLYGEVMPVLMMTMPALSGVPDGNDDILLLTFIIIPMSSYAPIIRHELCGLYYYYPIPCILMRGRKL